jgi:hypothetical protein
MSYYNDYFEMLKKIQKKLYFYLGNISLKYLRPFLLGYEFCASAIKECSVRFPKDFDSYIRKKYNHKSWSCGPFDILELFEMNEKEGFDNFYELLNIFEESRRDLTENVMNDMFVSKSGGTNRINDYYFEIFNMMRKNPKMYFNLPSIKYLEAYSSGYFNCAKLYQVPFNPHDGFDRFLQRKYNIEAQNNIFRIIEFIFWNDGEKAFYMFFELLDEFLRASE